MVPLSFMCSLCIHVHVESNRISSCVHVRLYTVRIYNVAHMPARAHLCVSISSRLEVSLPPPPHSFPLLLYTRLT